MLNPTVVNNYVNDLGKIMHDLNLTEKPKQIWNMDETGKQFEHNPVRVVARKGSKNLPGRTSNQRTNTTLVACVNASGQAMPTLIIVKGKTKRSLYSWNTTAAPKCSKWVFQENAWMTEAICLSWFNDIFLENCGDARPQLLICDSHKSHEAYSILETARENNIHTLALPPHNTTHRLQPLDKNVFGPFSCYYNEACTEYLSASPLNTINKWYFPELLASAWERSMTAKNITSGFATCGIYPYRSNAVDKEDFMPSRVFDRPFTTTLQEAQVNVSPLSNPAMSSPSAASDPLLSHLSFQSETPTSSMTSPGSYSASPSPSTAVSTITVLVPRFYSDDPNKAVELVPATEGETNEILSLFPDLEGTADQSDTPASEILPLFPDFEETAGQSDTPTTTVCNWNAEVESIFALPESKSKSESQIVSKRKCLTSHRLLTSNDVVEEKKQKQMGKENILEAKKKRQIKRETKKAIKFLEEVNKN